MPFFSAKVPQDFPEQQRLDKFIASLPNGMNRSKLKSGVTEILVNGKKVNIPSYQVKAGDVIEVREKSKGLALVAAAIESQSRDFPGYLEVDSKKLTAKYTFVPKFDDVPYAAMMEPNLVIEYYSR